MDKTPTQVVKVAVFCPNLNLLDYLWPLSEAGLGDPSVGVRVRVPLGPRSAAGIVMEILPSSLLPTRRLRPVTEVLGHELTPDLCEFIFWASRYYQIAPGLAFQSVLPPALKSLQHSGHKSRIVWRTTGPVSEDRLHRLGTTSRHLLDQLRGSPEGCEDRSFPASSRRLLRTLHRRGLVLRVEMDGISHEMARQKVSTGKILETPPEVLNPAQLAAVGALSDGPEHFRCVLLEGVTGSGKTRVYLEVARRCLARGQSSLILVPEIALTPQLTHEAARILGAPPLVYHSERSSAERDRTWQIARRPQPYCVVGTRSALFLPLINPGLIVIDEEHDTSFKQQEGFRYSARDLAVWRARQLDVPIILGSATPSLETLANVESGRYQVIRLPERAGTGQIPESILVDIRGQSLTGGLAASTLVRMAAHLEADGQVLVYLDRRGFARHLVCPACGWVAECPECAASFTVHRTPDQLLCHRCGGNERLPGICPHCGESLLPRGTGTERIEAVLSERFPDVGVVRLDRDRVSRKEVLETILSSVRERRARILVGTQMVTKGHDFHGVTLVIVVDADQGLFSADFRAPERLGQRLVQVAGRAGRGTRPGSVLLQTRHPEHPLFQDLLAGSYAAFARRLLDERRAAGWPPYGHLVLATAESSDRERARGFLEDAGRRLAAQAGGGDWVVWGPAPALRAKQAGRWRFQLLIRGESRASLQRACGQLLNLRIPRTLRFHLDVDPYDLG